MDKAHEIQITVELEDIIISKSIYSLQDFWCYLFERRVCLNCYSDVMQYNRNRISQKGKNIGFLHYTKLTILYVNTNVCFKLEVICHAFWSTVYLYNRQLKCNNQLSGWGDSHIYRQGKLSLGFIIDFRTVGLIFLKVEELWWR